MLLTPEQTPEHQESSGGVKESKAETPWVGNSQSVCEGNGHSKSGRDRPRAAFLWRLGWGWALGNTGHPGGVPATSLPLASLPEVPLPQGPILFVYAGDLGARKMGRAGNPRGPH